MYVGAIIGYALSFSWLATSSVIISEWTKVRSYLLYRLAILNAYIAPCYFKIRPPHHTIIFYMTSYLLDGSFFTGGHFNATRTTSPDMLYYCLEIPLQTLSSEWRASSFPNFKSQNIDVSIFSEYTWKDNEIQYQRPLCFVCSSLSKCWSESGFWHIPHA